MPSSVPCEGNPFSPADAPSKGPIYSSHCGIAIASLCFSVCACSAPAGSGSAASVASTSGAAESPPLSSGPRSQKGIGVLVLSWAPFPSPDESKGYSVTVRCSGGRSMHGVLPSREVFKLSADAAHSWTSFDADSSARSNTSCIASCRWRSGGARTPLLPDAWSPNSDVDSVPTRSRSLEGHTSMAGYRRGAVTARGLMLEALTPSWLPIHEVTAPMARVSTPGGWATSSSGAAFEPMIAGKARS